MTLKSTEYVQLLNRTLKRGVAINVSSVKDILSGDIYKFTLITINGIKRCLLQIPDEILTNDSNEIFGAIDDVRDCFVDEFGKNVTLYIIHHDSPHPSIMLLTKKLWQKRVGVKVRYIALKIFQQLHEMKQEAREEFLKDELELDLLPDRVEDRRSVSDIPHKEVKQLGEIIADLDAFKEGPKERRNLVEDITEFRKWARTFNFHGSPLSVAQSLVRYLIDRSLDREDNSLGKFLNHISGITDLRRDYKDFIDNTMKKYHLEPER